MKHKKTYLILVMLVLMGFSTGKFVKGQEYNYYSTLITDASYEWQVTKLNVVGSISTSFLLLNDTTLEVGDNFTIKITDNVDTLANGTDSDIEDISKEWAEFYLNGELKTSNITDIGFLFLDFMSWSDGEHFFLQPVTYTNETDTYNHFEILQNNFEQITADIKTETNEVNYHEDSHLTMKQSSKLSKSTWTIKYQTKLIYKEEDYTGPGGWSKDDDVVDRIIEIRFNVETGFVTYLSYYYNSHSISEVDGLQTIDDDTIDLVIESTMLPTGAPFNWYFSIIGVFVLGLVVYVKRRK